VRWTELTWDDLTDWAGARSVERGRSYQRGGRVKKLAISDDGRLLATVAGTERYATTVSFEPARGQKALASSCTCPVGINCKHAVATVAEYLHALAEGRDVPLARENDPRWDALDGDGEAFEFEEEWDDEDAWDDEEDYAPAVKPRASKKKEAARKPGPVDWDAKI
jgi:uncharacterized Zn finger protein